MPKRISRTKYKGQAAKTALALFGAAPRCKMETREDRETMALALRLSDKPVMRELARQALDPMFKHTSFAKLAENNALNIHMLSDEFKNIMRSEGFMRAAQHLPDLMEQVAHDAKSRDVKCKDCGGTGTITRIIKGKGGDDDIEERDPCTKCEGKGTRYVLGNVERLRLMFETFGLTGGKGAPLINLDMRKLDPHESMASLSESIAPLLEGNKQS